MNGTNVIEKGGVNIYRSRNYGKDPTWSRFSTKNSYYRVDFLNAVYFRQGLTCTLGLTNDLKDGGQPRDKPHKVKQNHVLKTIFSARLATVFQVVG